MMNIHRLTPINPVMRRGLLSIVLSGSLLIPMAYAEDFSEFSLEELMDVSISSASKREQKLSETPAAISVITKEDIKRRGVQTLPDALRLVPGVHVAQVYNDSWAISIRGFADEYSNKLLVLVDGQSVYTELYSGVFWQISDVLVEDIEQIEVIRGPGASIWGVNAVNGVINIITKNAADQTNLAKVSASNFGHREVVTGKANLSENTNVRYSLASRSDDGFGGTRVGANVPPTYTEASARNSDGDWQRHQLNLRLDHSNDGKNWLMIYDKANLDTAWDSVLFGATSSNNEFDQERFITQYSRRVNEKSEYTVRFGYRELEVTLDGLTDIQNEAQELELRHQYDWSGHQLIYGFNYRDWTSDSRSLSPLNVAIALSPEKSTTIFKGFFFQNDFFLRDDLNLVIGARIDNNSSTGSEYQPTVRVIKELNDDNGYIWASVSRAVRTPSRFEREIAVNFPTQQQGIPVVAAIQGNSGLEAETTDVFELGYRNVWSANFSTDITLFRHEYEDIITFGQVGMNVFTTPITVFQSYANGAEADLYGVEWSFDWNYKSYRFGVNGSWISLEMDEIPGFAASTGSYPSDPEWQVGTYVRWDYSQDWAFDIWSQFVDSFQAGSGTSQVSGESFLRLDFRIAYSGVENLVIAFIGQDIADRGDVQFQSANPVFKAYSSVIAEPVYRVDVSYDF